MKTVTFAFGRFNPPTAGHEKLVNVVKKQPGTPLMFLSHTQDKKKNPLSYKTKGKWFSKAFGGKILKRTSSRTIIEIMQELEKAGFTQVTYVAGADRIKDFDRLLNKQNGVDYNFPDGIKVVSAGARDPDAEGVTGMSATKMRKAALEDDIQSFLRGTPSKLNKLDATKMFNDLRKAMG